MVYRIVVYSIVVYSIVVYSIVVYSRQVRGRLEGEAGRSGPLGSSPVMAL